MQGTGYCLLFGSANDLLQGHCFSSLTFSDNLFSMNISVVHPMGPSEVNSPSLKLVKVADIQKLTGLIIFLKKYSVIEMHLSELNCTAEKLNYSRGRDSN